ncbi:hypothetical protein GOV14_04715 [Candidatus Pacearchaeota archaeon]|nr:hypothetical protein [Candidatus Pacearchaeota archaeon]
MKIIKNKSGQEAVRSTDWGIGAIILLVILFIVMIIIFTDIDKAIIQASKSLINKLIFR